MGYIKNVKIGNDTHLIEPILYGDCSTAADTAEKYVSIPNFELVDGVRIAIYFNNPNTATNVKLNVNGTGALSIRYSSNRETTTARTITSATPVLYGLRYFLYRGVSNMWYLEEDALSLSKYTDDTAYGKITFRGTNNNDNYIKINGTNTSSGDAPGINFYIGSYWTALKAMSANSTSFEMGFYNPTRLSGLATPTADTEAANKKYVDDKFALALPLTGGTLTGALTLAADPTTNLGAATKQYVDTAVSNVTASIEVVRLI